MDMEEALSSVSVIRAGNLILSLSPRSSQSPTPILYTSSVLSARRGCAQRWSQSSSRFSCEYINLCHFCVSLSKYFFPLSLFQKVQQCLGATLGSGWGSFPAVPGIEPEPPTAKHVLSPLRYDPDLQSPSLSLHSLPGCTLESIFALVSE